MLRWAYGYLAMAVVVAIGFAVVQGTHRAERRVVTPATSTTQRAHAAWAPTRRSSRAKASRRTTASIRTRAIRRRRRVSGQGELEYGTPAEDPGEWENEGEWEDEGSLKHESNLEYVVQPGAGGHYVVEAAVNGAPVTFLVDTGASDIVLTMADAERLGFQPATLRFTQRFATANGEVRGAPVVLREIRVGQFSLFDVPASVNEAPLRVSLLGMSFLRQLDGYGVENGRLVLRW